MNPRLRTIIRTSSRVLLAAAVLLAVGSATVWVFRTDLLTYFAKAYLQEIGFEKPELQIRSLESDLLVAESISLARNGSSLSIDTLELSFSLQELLRQSRIQEVHITGLAATIQWPVEATESTSPTASIPTLKEWSERLDSFTFPTLPLNRIQVTNSRLIFQTSERRISASVEVNLSASTPSSLLLEAHLASGIDEIGITAQLTSPDHRSIETRLRLSSPLATLHDYLPHWRSNLPELQTLTTGPLDLHARLDLPSNAEPQLQLRLTAQTIAIEHESLSARISSLHAKSTLSNFTQIPLQLTIVPERLSSNELSVSPNLPIALALTVSDLSVFNILTQIPIAWDYDSGFVQGKSLIEIDYDSKNLEDPLAAKIETASLRVDDFALLPVSLEANGTPDAINFRSSPIRLADAPQFSIGEGSGTLLIPSSENEPISFAFKSLASANELLIHGETATLPSLDLHLATTVFDDATRTQVDLASPHAARAGLPRLGEIIGDLTLHLDVSKDSHTELYSGKATLDASEISIQSKLLSGDGIAIQSIIDFHNLDSQTFTDQTFADPTQLHSLLKQLETQLDWQANRLVAQDIEAQWCGGSISLQHRGKELHLESSLGAGIFAYDKLRLEQAYTENELQGTLQHLAGTSRTTALIDGASLEINSHQTIRDPLSHWSLEGEYDISPIAFLHSDLPARVVPELAGLSLSTQLQAKGVFHATEQAIDSSLTLNLTEGSIALPAYQISAQGVELELHLDSLANLDSGTPRSRLSIGRIEAGDAQASHATSTFRIRGGSLLSVDSAAVSVFGGTVLLNAADIPIDGSDFQGSLALQELSLKEITNYVEIFDGKMEGAVSGSLPFRLRNGRFELLSGNLSLPSGSSASLQYDTKGLLTTDKTPGPQPQPTASERLLKFLKIDPDRTAEQALGNITITRFEAQLLPEDEPETPIRIRMEGIAHSELTDIPVVISTQVNGSLSELYNFLIRLNSL